MNNLNVILQAVQLITTGKTPEESKAETIMMNHHKKRVREGNELSIELDQECRAICIQMYGSDNWDVLPEFAMFPIWGMALRAHKFTDEEKKENPPCDDSN